MLAPSVRPASRVPGLKTLASPYPARGYDACMQAAAKPSSICRPERLTGILGSQGLVVYTRCFLVLNRTASALVPWQY